MKKNRNGFIVGPAFLAIILLLVAFLTTSCIFESDDNGLESWLSTQGMPSSYKMQTLSIENIKPVSAEAFLDTFPKSADARAVLGHRSNLTHDLVMDFAFSPKSSFIKTFKDSDTSGSFLVLFWQRDFYKMKQFPKDSLPLKDELTVNVSWILETSKNSNFIDSLMDVEDSTWYESLTKWEPDASADTTLKIKMAKGDTSIRMEMPSALVEAFKKIKGSAHLQLRLSAPEAAREYRFNGDATSYPPILAIFADSTTYISPNPFRMANIVKNEEDCSDCPILHGGVFDSLVIELPPEPILDALSEFYGDEFPFTKGDGNDVRQTVILAELKMLRDDSKGCNELGQPIQVVVGSYVDSADTQVRRMENYRLNNEVILENGHQNLVFHDGDSLTVQLTAGLRDFVNRASDGRNMKFIMRMGYPFLQERDTAYTNYRTDAGDTSFVFLNYFDYARYDFSTSMENPMTLKLWLASKRGDE